MNRIFWRSLLTCLLLVALPLKGFAAASMLNCGPAHQQLFGTVAHDGAPAASSWHQHSDGGSHHHAATEAAGAVSTPSDVAATDSPSAAQIPQLNAKFKCNSCAPCCLSVALTTNVTMQAIAPASSADFLVFAPYLPSTPVGRLDRPPRTLFA